MRGIHAAANQWGDCLRGDIVKNKEARAGTDPSALL
jgi:hypothetical protein